MQVSFEFLLSAFNLFVVCLFEVFVLQLNLFLKTLILKLFLFKNFCKGLYLFFFFFNGLDKIIKFLLSLATKLVQISLFQLF